MSSRFVSRGTLDAQTGEITATATITTSIPTLLPLAEPHHDASACVSGSALLSEHGDSEEEEEDDDGDDDGDSRVRSSPGELKQQKQNEEDKRDDEQEVEGNLNIPAVRSKEQQELEQDEDHRDGSDAWAAAHREIAQQREDAARAKAAMQEGGGEMSLYAVLAANKAAKQAEFDEAHAIRNQFRALDEDEVEFLDEVVASQRREEEQRRKAVEGELATFRRMQREQKQRAAARETAVGIRAAEAASDWDDVAAGKRRKRSLESEAGTHTIAAGSLGMVGKLGTVDFGLVKKKRRLKDDDAKQEDSARTGALVAVAPTVMLVDYGSDSE